MEALYRLAVMVSAIDQLTGPLQTMARSFSNFESNIQRGTAMVDWGNKMAVSSVLVQGAADSSINALKKVMEPVVDVETALGELASVGVKDLNTLSQASEDFTRLWAGTSQAQFISSAYDIKGGIESLSDVAVAEYTRMAALTATATKANVGQMTSLFATGYGIYKGMYDDMDDIQFAELFSAGLTAAVQQFKSDGPAMSMALTNIGASATSAGIAMEEQFSVLGMLQATMPGGESGTKYRAFIQTAARAGKTLGLSFTDANNQLLGMADILDVMRGKYGDTLDAMEQLEIKKAFGSDEAVALINLLYPQVDELRSNIDSLGETMQHGTVYTQGIAEAMNSGLGEQLQIVDQNITVFKRSIGDELSPLIKEFIPVVRDLVTGFQSMAQTHPTLVRTALLILSLGAVGLSILAPILAIVAGITMIAGYTIWGAGQIGKAFVKLRGISTSSFRIIRLDLGLFRAGFATTFSFIIHLLRMFSAGMVLGFTAIKNLSITAGRAILTFGRSALITATRALPALIGSVWSFTAALLANPVTWIVIGIIALCAAIYLLWKNWDTVTAALGKGWDWLMTKFDAGKQWISGILQGIADLAYQYGPIILAAICPIIGIPLLIAQHWDGIKATASETWSYVSQLVPEKITEIINGITTRAANLYSSGRALIQAFVDGIKSLINKPAEVVKNGLAKLAKLLPHSDAQEGPLSTLTSSGAALMNTFATGISSRSEAAKLATAAALTGIALTMPMPLNYDVQAAEIPQLAMATPSVKSALQPGTAITAPAVMNIKIPDIDGQANIAPVMGNIPGLPELSSQALINPIIGSIPGLPDITGQAKYFTGLGEVAELADTAEAGINIKEKTRPLSKIQSTPAVKLREVIKETSREREKESTHIKDRRPVVMFIESQKQGESQEDLIDRALRELEARG